ncbi:hypothetical protein FG152_17630 [Ochrobactrum sp. XJ1]|nr:hypothetical protein [Ochrobactrum sp. XJ1]
MSAPDVEQQDAASLLAAKAVSDDVKTVSNPPQAGPITGEAAKAVAAVDLTVNPGAAQATDSAAPAVSRDDDVVAAESDIQTRPSARRAPAPRRGKNKADESVTRRQLANAATVTPLAFTLDDEIKLLRSELIGKLRLQNSQLKTMLERFKC